MVLPALFDERRQQGRGPLLHHAVAAGFPQRVPEGPPVDAAANGGPGPDDANARVALTSDSPDDRGNHVDDRHGFPGEVPHG